MPAITTCPICKFHGNHGFVLSDRLSGIMYYHTSKETKDDHCWWIAIDGQIYKDRLTAFKAGAKHLGESLKTNWHQAMIAKITNHPRKAEKLFRAWKKEQDY